MTKKQMNERRKALDEFLSETYGDDVVHFDGPEFDGGIVGVTTDGRLVYSYDKLVRALMEANKWDETDAIDWVEFNTLRSLPYIHGKAPVVMNDLDPDDFLFKQLAFTGGPKKKKKSKITR